MTLSFVNTSVLYICVMHCVSVNPFLLIHSRSDSAGVKRSADALSLRTSPRKSPRKSPSKALLDTTPKRPQP